MADRIILSDESINSYGFRVLTEGIDLSAFSKNPVMLYDHRSFADLPIGTWADYRIEGSQLSAVPVFDIEDKEAAAIAGKYDRKVLNAASIGIQVQEMSDDPALMIEGQTGPTVTKCLLYEASIVPVPSNTNAVRLYRNGEAINMSDTKAVTLALGKKPNHIIMQDSVDKTEEKGGLFAQLNSKVDQILKQLSGKKSDEKPAPIENKTELKQEEASDASAELSVNAELSAVKAENESYKKELYGLNRKVDELVAAVKELSGAPAVVEEIPAPAQDAKTPTKEDHFAALNARAVSKFSKSNPNN